MKDEMFQELLESVKEGGAILRGEKQPSRTFTVEDPDVRGIRAQLGFTQQRFARLIGISVATLRNWEQGRRRPAGSARVLLLIAARHPETVRDVLCPTDL